MENSIVAGNVDNGTAPDLRPNSSSTPVVNDSLVGETTGSGITASTGTGNILDQLALLGVLANNGGPTQTHSLLPGSPAIDAGFSVEPYDQRGFARDDGHGIDIGAFESQGTAPLVSSILIDDGTAQRSVVRSITVNFNVPIIFDAGAFELKDDENNPVDVTTSVAPGTLTSQVVLTFNGGGADASGSLLDADYTLKVLDTKVRSATGVFLDGNNNGSMGGDAVDVFYRLFGDGNGDGFTDFDDFALSFLPAFGTEIGVGMGYLARMDFDGDGFVDFDDFANGFLPNFGKSR
jgi:hypothetical protein